MGERVFIYDGREFPDPDPNMSVDDVRRSLTDFFPELSNAETKERKEGDRTVVEFTRRVGTKGLPKYPYCGNCELELEEGVHKCPRCGHGEIAVGETVVVEAEASRIHEVPREPIVFNSEETLWRMMAEIGVTGLSGKPFDMRRWDMSDNRIYQLAQGRTGPDAVWTPQVKEVSFRNKATGELLTFEFTELLFEHWAPGWCFLILGRCIVPGAADGE